MAANIPSIKVERDDQQPAMVGQVKIKPEPDSRVASPSAMSEDDIYEDAGDLDFGPGQDKAVWLVRIPKFLWDQWEQIGDDEEVELGKVRVEPSENGKEKLSLLLSPALEEQYKDLPREYNMQVTNYETHNTFIFTEKDLSGYAKSMRSNPAADTKFPPMPTRFLQTERDKRGDGQKWEKGKRWQPYFRKAIPKHTAMAATVKHEVNCLPVENEEYKRLMAKRAAEASKPKLEVKSLDAIIAQRGGNPNNPGHINDALKGFIKTGVPPRAKGTQDLKAARMPQNELKDYLFRCFSQYKYWSMKTLKAAVNQPEAYLRATLEEIAVLVRSGTYAMNWTLKPEYAKVGDISAMKMEEAPDTLDNAGDRDDDGIITIDDDDDNEAMEDVLP